MQTRNSSNLKGIDVSHWDGDVDYAKVKSQDIKVVYIKATQGENSVDAYLKSNAKNAKDAGLLTGFYHFFTPTTEDSAKKQAAHFVDTIKNYNFDCKLALDIEKDGGLSSSTLTNLCLVFLEEVKKLSGKDVVVYTYTSFAKEHLQKTLAIYPLWIAQYGVNSPSSNNIWDSWVGFQYSEKGSVRGINTDCDLNEFTNGILLSTSTSNSNTIPKPAPVISQPPKNNTDKSELTYTVKYGDTLSSIASKYSTTVDNLVKLNNIKNPNSISIGQVIKLK